VIPDDRQRQRELAYAASRRRVRRQLAIGAALLALVLVGGAVLGAALSGGEKARLTTRDVTIGPLTLTQTVATRTVTVP
jgi:hypothetical protein